MQTSKTKYWLTILVALTTASLLFTACDKQPIRPTQPDPYTYLPIRQFRDLYQGTDIVIPNGTRKIRGVVISNNLNESNGNFRIQDQSGAGFILYAPGSSFALNDVLEIDATGGGSFALFSGDLELKSVPAANISKLANDSLPITPRVATIKTAIDSINRWASTLVTFNNVTITAGSTNSAGQNYNVTDATGTIISFVRTTSGITLPTGGATSITGYLSIFQQTFSTTPTYQFIVRKAADVVGGGTGGGTGGGGTGTGITLATSPYTIDFNSIGTDLPTGVTVDTAATANFLGKVSTLTTSNATGIWNKTTGGFKNYASATGLTQGADSATQANATNRALGVRQTGTAGSGGDPGAAFVFQLNNTTGKNNLKMDFQLQSLDTSSVVTRTTTWTVDYGIGDNPTTFTPATTTGTTTTGNKVFSNVAITATFPAAVNNQSQKVWIRIAALTPTTGSNNRPSTAIDDVKFTWN